MKGGSILIVFVFILIFLLSGLFYYYTFNGEEIFFEEFAFEENFNVSGNIQFYDNMRYKSSRLSYNIDDTCDFGKIENVKEAFSILSEKTILEFYESENGHDIEILCADISPSSDEKGHFVAGEGGPSEVVQAGKYNVVLLGKISLFRIDKCDKPQIAVHEILHALGFDHNTNRTSILYPITNCKQEIDDYIIDEINSLYSIKSLPDLSIEKAEASKIGRYLNFEIIVFNVGFKDAEKSKLRVFAEDTEIREFDLEELNVGAKRILTVENLRLPLRKIDSVKFSVEFEPEELSKSNNILIMNLV